MKVLKSLAILAVMGGALSVTGWTPSVVATSGAMAGTITELAASNRHNASCKKVRGKRNKRACEKAQKACRKVRDKAKRDACMAAAVPEKKGRSKD